MDHIDVIPVSDSSDEGSLGTGTATMNVFTSKSGEKRKSSTTKQKGNTKKISAQKLSFSVDRATIVIEEVVMEINTIISPNENACVACVKEMLARDRSNVRCLFTSTPVRS